MANDEQQKLEHEELSVGDIALTVSLGIAASLGKYLNNTQYVPRHPSTRQSSYSREQIERFAATNVRFDKDIPVENRIRLTAHYQEVLEKLPTWQQVLAIESGTPIRFTSGLSNSSESRETLGSYHAKSGKLFVRADAGNINKTIRHEMGHEADGKSGPLFGWWSEEKTDWRLALRAEINRWDVQGEETSFLDKLKSFLSSDDNQIKNHLSRGYKVKDWPLEAIAEVTVMQNKLYDKYAGDQKKVDAEMNRLQPHLWPVYRDHYIPHLQNIAAKLNPHIDLQARPIGVIHAAAPEMVAQPFQQQQAQVHGVAERVALGGAARNGEKPWTHDDWARLAREMAPPPVEGRGPIIDKGLPYLPGEPADPRVPQHLVKPVPVVPQGANLRTLKQAGLGGYAVGAVIRGGMAYLNHADGGTVAHEAGLGLADALVPGASNGFAGITGKDGSSNGVDRVLNGLDTATGTSATGGVVAAPFTGGGSLVVTGVAGLANLGVNLVHDVTYVAGASNQGGLVVNSKELALGLLDIAASKQELAQRKENIPQAAVDQLLAAIPRDGVATDTPDALFNDFMKARHEARSTLAEHEDAARTYLAQGGTVATAQAAMTGDYDTLMRQQIANVLTVVPQNGLDGTTKSGFVSDPHLTKMAVLKTQFVASGSSDAALMAAMQNEAAQYIQSGGNAAKAVEDYYHRGPGVDTETLAGLKGTHLAPIIEAQIGKKESYSAGDVMTAAARLGAELARMDINHDGKLAMNELRDGFERPQDFKPATQHINFIR